MARLFVSQKRLDQWTDEGKMTIDGDRLTLPELGRVFRVIPAVRFLRVVGDDDDPHTLVDKVLAEQKLAEMGADHFATSVIYGETAYEVQQGFLGTPE